MFDVISPSDPPADANKAVVMMFGWLGAQQKHVKKYADIYVKNLSYTVVYGTAPVTGAITRNKNKLVDAVSEAVQTTASIIKEMEKLGTSGDDNVTVPVIVHHFSNGGCYMAEQLSILIKEAQNGTLIDVHEDFVGDLKIIGHRLQQKGSCELADSAPVYMHISSAMRGIEAAVSSTPIRIVVKSVFWASIIFNRLISLIKREDIEPVEFWKNMINSKLCPRQAFIYSSADHVTDVVKLEELIEERKKIVDVSVLKFDDSGHVQHYRKYPKEYIEFVVQQVQKSLAKGGKDNLQ